jgi:predicted peptidase
LEKSVKGPGFSLKSRDAVPKTEVLEQPHVCNLFLEEQRMNKFITKFLFGLTAILLVALSVACSTTGSSASGGSQSSGSKTSSIKSVMTISETFGDGQKVTTVVCEYEKDIDPASISIEDFTVKDRKIIAVHANSEVAQTTENKIGRYIILDLEVQSPLLDDTLATDGRVVNYKSIDSATVIQKGSIKAVDGTIYAADSTPVSTKANSGIMGNEAKIHLIRDDFEDSHSYTDPEWKTVMRYNLFKPRGYGEGDTSTKYPLVLFMADAGAEGKDWEIVLLQGNGGTVWASNEWQENHPCFVVTMIFEEKFINDYWEYWENNIGGTMNLVRSLTTKYPIDTDRLYTTGQSMGCMASLIMMIKDPTLFAAAYCIAGQWETQQLLALKNSKLFILNSEDDAMATKWMDAAASAWEADGTRVVRGNIDGIANAGTHADVIDDMFAQNSNIYYLKINSGTGSMDLNGNPLRGSHRYTWRLGYDLPRIKEWLFEQSKS